MKRSRLALAVHRLQWSGPMLYLDRREFVRSLVAALALPATGIFRAGGPRLVFTYCRHLETILDSIDDGIAFGIEEARHAAAMFGGTVDYRFVSLGGSPIAGRPSSLTPIDPLPDAIQVVIPARMDGRTMAHVVATSGSAGAIVINVASRDDAIFEGCQRHVFHVMASPDTLRVARASQAADPKAGEIELWSPALERFGAASLNRRYQESRSREMDSRIWGGWFAVKCAWEAALQSRATTAAALIGHLESPAARFDGHKGAALWFNASHELVQPLYLVDAGAVVGETAPLPLNPPHGVRCE